MSSPPRLVIDESFSENSAPPSENGEDMARPGSSTSSTSSSSNSASLDLTFYSDQRQPGPSASGHGLSQAIWNASVADDNAKMAATAAAAVATTSTAKRDFPCPICGDNVTGYHYGVPTCESCKGFFRRSIQKQKTYKCSNQASGQMCTMSKESRKRCAYCRFLKCQQVGMDPEAIRPDGMRGGRQRSSSETTPQKKMTPKKSEGTISKRQQQEEPNQREEANPFSMLQNQSMTITPIIRQMSQPSTSTSTNIAPASTSSSFKSPAGYLAVTSCGKKRKKTFTLPPMIQQFQSTMIKDGDWQRRLLERLQKYHGEVGQLQLMCELIEQALFATVDWASCSVFFKDLTVPDQKKLLVQVWSQLLLLDHLHQRYHLGLPDTVPLATGESFDIISLALLGASSLTEQYRRLTGHLATIDLDANDYLCLKFYLLFNADCPGLSQPQLVRKGYRATKQAMLEYTANFYPHVENKFYFLLLLLDDLATVTQRGEEYLLQMHQQCGVPSMDTMLMEMLVEKEKLKKKK